MASRPQLLAETDGLVAPRSLNTIVEAHFWYFPSIANCTLLPATITRAVARIIGMMRWYSMPFRMTADLPISLKTISPKGLGGGRGMSEFCK